MSWISRDWNALPAELSDAPPDVRLAKNLLAHAASRDAISSRPAELDFA
jgi:hypothetical protein